MSNNLTFVEYQDPGVQAQRIRSRRACSECRHKKRRCSHQLRKPFGPQTRAGRGSHLTGFQSIATSQNTQLTDSRPEAETEQTSHEDPHRSPSVQSITAPQQQYDKPRNDRQHQQLPSRHGAQSYADQPCTSDEHTSPPTTRFVGDLNPQTRLLLGNSIALDDELEVGRGEVGVWLQAQARPCSKCGCLPDTFVTSSPASRGLRSLPSDLLSQNTIKGLSDLYFTNVHPILPLLNKEEYWQSLSSGTSSTPLLHVVCLLSAKDNAAEKFLKFLYSGDTLVSVREFCSRLYMSISAALSRRNSMRKLTLVRILGLLSLHHEGSDGADQASCYIAEAINHAQTLTLHLPRPVDTNNELKRVFWCLWTLDRLNAATNARPCHMSDVDISIPELTQEESGYVAFDVWFRIARILNKVIEFYRPKLEDPVSGLDSGFPAFEQIMDEMHAWQLSQSSIATLHIFYLAIAVLGHRLKAITSLPPPTPARLRQQLATVQVIRYMEDTNRLNALHPFPIAVYAVSLALSVSYQQLKFSRLPSDREDARRDFQKCCVIMQELRRKWGCADAMGSLAQKISAALDHPSLLDELRANQCGPVSNDSSLTGNSGAGITQKQCEDHQISALSAGEHPLNYQMLFTGLDTMDPFATMDDISWMNLGAGDPSEVGHDNFPSINFNDHCSSW
ncbi:hypothetical protein LTS17_006532 [Exophiala oligosperma]